MILHRYVLREVALSTAVVAVALIAIFLGYSLTRFLTDAAVGMLTAAEVALLTVYKAVVALEVLLPLALYFGLVIGFGRLNAGSEIVAMHAGGLARRRLQRPVVFASLLLAALVAMLSGTVRPWAYDTMYELRARAEAASELGRIRPRRFYLFEDRDRAVYVESIERDSGRLGGVFVRTRDGSTIEVIAAHAGRLDSFATTSAHRLELEEASVYKSVEGGADFHGSFDRLTLYLAAGTEIVRDYRAKAESTAGLYLSGSNRDRAELQWRLSTPVSTLLLALAALRLTDTRPRDGRYSRIPAALAIYAVYYNLLGLARTWVEQGTMAHLWWVPALLAAGLALPSLRNVLRVRPA